MRDPLAVVAARHGVSREEVIQEIRNALVAAGHPELAQESEDLVFLTALRIFMG